MPGTREGGLKAAATNKQRYGDGRNGTESFYSKIGRKGGLKSRGGIFQKDHEFARAMGHKGGSVSKRKKAAA